MIMSAEDLKWQRREDARTLARAEEIIADKERYNNAKIGAREILQEEQNRLKGLNKVAGKRVKTETPQEPTMPFSYRRNNPAKIR